ncbi:heparan-alpha-glucosaminide N-acetyltransferase domain-containing protein [Anaerolineales bacterium HSG25]|nr:heparan-alpha-glucosaminide N-acetyltransferase domain-containing protein [Anaerolineales bacterium HSG25]
MTVNTLSRPKRIEGYDFARALAILGMILVNFKIVLEASEAGSAWLVWSVGLLEGRAAAMFVILAGVGLTLLSNRARQQQDLPRLAQHRRALLKRAMFLFLVGLLYTPIWPADILHFYGLYIVVGAFLLSSSDRGLWGWALLFTGGFVALLLLFDYETGWDWKTITYIDLWTPVGMTRHLFFNGFHPVFPWTAFLLLGMWLGRQDVRSGRVRGLILAVSIIVVLLTKLLSSGCFYLASSVLDASEVGYICGSQPMPPMPLYIFSGGGTAIAMIMLSVGLTERFPTSRWLKAFITTGQLALTLYVAHVVIGMGVLELFGLLTPQTLWFSVLYGFGFYLTGMLFAVLWSTRFRRGPLEAIMRRLV